MATKTLPLYEEVELDTWLRFMRESWEQGQHIAIVGPTGRGKTTLAHLLLDIRTYVVVLAVKRDDDTLDRFRDGGSHAQRRMGLKYTKYKVIKKWPPQYGWKRVVLWLKPESFKDLREQAVKLYHALENIYLAGGWCVYFDETGYIAGNLGLGAQLSVLLNQGRSSGLSIVASMTRPHSLFARIPSETLNQCRHIIIFRYKDEREAKACAEIAGISFTNMKVLMSFLGKYDFLYVGEEKLALVRNS